MLRQHTQAQESKTQSPETRPVYLVCWEHSGVLELMSCSGSVVFDGQAFQPTPGLEVSNVRDSQSATITVSATPERIMQVQNNTWREGACKIYCVPVLPSDGASYTAEQSILQLDGKIVSSSFRGNVVTVEAMQKTVDGFRTPRNRLDEFGGHMPAAGTVLTWEGNQIVLVTRE